MSASGRAWSAAIAVLLVLASVTAGCAGSVDTDERADTAPSVNPFSPSGTLFPAPEPAGGTGSGSGDDAGGRALAQTGGVIVGHALGRELVAHQAPDPATPVVARLTNPTDVGGPLVVQLVGDGSKAFGAWVEVFLPVRPNGTTGWVRRTELQMSRNPWRIDVDASDHRLEIRRDGLLWLSTTVGIGTGATPTPRGRFYVIELLAPPNPEGLYGPYAFGLSGFSETLSSFAGGPGVIGIHGTDQPSALGTDVSHGCVRVHNDIITLMAEFVPLGTPVVISD
jgi:lipoprotein-anchoring transpeptidase ErfK/SrfK